MIGRRLCCGTLCRISTWDPGEEPHRVRCYCSRDRMERALISLGPEELQAMIDEQGSADLTCRFCDNVQRFSRQIWRHGPGLQKNVKINSS
ncbi:MAG: Hsp33 family molecular chaperone HslO [Dysosmobacter welbionis]